MRTTILLSLALLLTLSLAYAHTDVTTDQVRAMMDTGDPLTIVDVREESEFCDSTYSPPGHIPGAINMTWYTGGLEENYSDLPMDEDIVVVCRSGGRSNQAANFLDGVGFTRIFDMLGGMNAWEYETELCYQAAVPGAYAGVSGIMLKAASPNPFSTETGIVYGIPADGGAAYIEVYDARGRLVRSIVEGVTAPGIHRAEWNGTDDYGRPAPSGVYFCRLTWRGDSKTSRMVLAR